MTVAMPAFLVEKGCATQSSRPYSQTRLLARNVARRQGVKYQAKYISLTRNTLQTTAQT
jgi:hypothetical protein